jgi:hypothetical protein
MSPLRRVVAAQDFVQSVDRVAYSRGGLGDCIRLMRFRHSITSAGEQERIYTKYWQPMERRLGSGLTNFLRHYAMKSGENIYLGGIYAATKKQFIGLKTPDDVELEIINMSDFDNYYARILEPELETIDGVRRRLKNLSQLDVTTSYPLLLRLFDARRLGKLQDEEFERCIELIEAFVVRRAVCVGFQRTR